MQNDDDVTYLEIEPQHILKLRQLKIVCQSANFEFSIKHSFNNPLTLVLAITTKENQYYLYVLPNGNYELSHKNAIEYGTFVLLIDRLFDYVQSSIK